MKHILFPALFCATSLLAVAGPITSESVPIDIPPPADSWEFRIMPYAWLTATDGTAGPQGFPAEIDAGFDDIFDSLEMAAALQFEVKRGRIGLIADAFYAELGNSGTLPGPLKTEVDVDFEMFIGELVVFYRVSESATCYVDLYTGVRHTALSLDLKATTTGTRIKRSASRSADTDWTDPIVGLRTQWALGDKWYLAAKGDVGGFSVGSDFAWNVQGSLGYKFNDTVSLEVGYRYFDTDYSDSNFTYDIAQHGALIGLNFNF